jgi:hypothetical protein
VFHHPLVDGDLCCIQLWTIMKIYVWVWHECILTSLG